MQKMSLRIATILKCTKDGIPFFANFPAQNDKKLKLLRLTFDLSAGLIRSYLKEHNPYRHDLSINKTICKV